MSNTSTSVATARTFQGMGLVGLHRAIVTLPDSLTSREEPLHERIVFFEAPSDAHPSSHLAELLALAWGVDTRCWVEHGYIYNCDSAFGTAWDAFAAGDDSSDLCLFEIAWGGPGGIGPRHVHYARAPRVDLFVTPLLAQRLRSALECIDGLYATSQAATIAAGTSRVDDANRALVGSA